MSDDNRKSGPRTSGLLGDLESIRSLLEEDEAQRDERAADEEHAAPEPAGTESHAEDEDVPLLEDVVHGGVSVNETFFSGQGDFQDDSDASGLDEEIFKALLSDEWRDSARTLLDQARQAIERHQTEWTPEHTDELNAALKVRIDETVQQWLRHAVQNHVDELRQSLLAALSDEIGRTVDAQFQRNPDEDPDGE